MAALKEAMAGGRLWVAEEAGAVVGFAVAGVLDGYAHLREVDVAVHAARRGHGTRLVGAVAAWAEAARLRGVTLATFSDVAWNRPWYERLGFVPATAAALGPGHVAVVEQDRAAGLDIERRTLMWRPPGGPRAPG